MTTVAAAATGVSLDRILAGAQLPALPQSAIKLLELSKNPDNGPAEFAVPIEADPGLTGQVLKFVNSSYFGFSREISGVRHAVTMVGIRTIKNFSLWSAVFSLMPNPKCGPFDLKLLWQDSLRRGLFARAFAKLLGQREAEDVFAAALLQDMAVPLLAKHLPKEYTELLLQRDGGRVRLSELEQQRFGWNHAEAGAKIARQWKLPAEFANCIACHATPLNPEALLESSPTQLGVSLSALLPSSLDANWLDRPQFESIYEAMAPQGCLGIGELFGQIDVEFQEFAPLLKLNQSARSLVECYAAAPAVIA